jgi:hypothetical protein
MHERYKWQKHRDVKSVRVKTLCGFESRHRQALSSSTWQLHALRVSHSVLRVVTPFQLLEAHIIFFAVINRFTSSNRQPGPAVKMPVFTSSCIWRNGETFATSPSSFRQNPSKECPSCFYRARPILCFCSFQGMLNASLRRAGASGVRNLTPSIDGSDGDLDSVGLSFATILETSARIAVVAARDVRRKDRRVCINQFSTPSCTNEPAIETAKTQMERIGPLIAISKTKARALGCSEM